MYKNIKISFLTVSLLIFCNVTNGQDNKTTTKADPLTKKIEITKRYAPKIGNAVKYDIAPGAVSRIKLDAPRFDYSIAYKPQSYAPKIYTLESFTIATQLREAPYNGYAEASFGVPLQSAFNAYYATSPKDNFFAAGGVNHYGFWGNLDNNLGNSVESKETQNSVFAIFDYKNSNIQATGKLSHSYNLYDMTGFAIPSLTTYSNTQNIYNVTNISMGITTPYAVGNQWDWSLNADGYYLSDNNNFNEMKMKFNAGFAKGSDDGKNRYSFNLEYIQYSPRTNLPSQSFTNTTPASSTSNIIFIPGYRRVGERSTLDLSVGLNIKFGNKYGKKGSDLITISPNLYYRLNLKNINLFAGVKSGYENNTYGDLINKNPYLISGQTAIDSYWTNIYLGLDGTISSWLSWSFEGGITFYNNLIYFYNVGYGNSFQVYSKDYENYGFVNTTLSAIVSDELSANISYNFRSLDLYTYAQHIVDFGIIYKITPKLLTKFNGEVMSSRNMTGLYYTEDSAPSEDIGDLQVLTNNIPTKIYLSIGAEYKLNERISATADIKNILNSKMYQFNNYRGLGINVMVGITAKF